MQDLNDLYYFAMVVDHGGFAAAERALGIPKSRLSRRISQLETDMGVRLLQKFAEDVAEYGTVESNPTIDGRNMVMVIAPHKNKSEVKTEQNAARAANKEAARQARTAGTAE